MTIKHDFFERVMFFISIGIFLVKNPIMVTRNLGAESFAKWGM